MLAPTARQPGLRVGDRDGRRRVVRSVRDGVARPRDRVRQRDAAYVRWLWPLGAFVFFASRVHHRPTARRGGHRFVDAFGVAGGRLRAGHHGRRRARSSLRRRGTGPDSQGSRSGRPRTRAADGVAGGSGPRSHRRLVRRRLRRPVRRPWSPSSSVEGSPSSLTIRCSCASTARPVGSTATTPRQRCFCGREPRRARRPQGTGRRRPRRRAFRRRPARALAPRGADRDVRTEGQLRLTPQGQAELDAGNLPNLAQVQGGGADPPRPVRLP